MPAMNAEQLERRALSRMDLDRAADRQAQFLNAEHTYELALEKRNAAVLALLERAGGRRGAQVEIAEALNISPGRVAQIAMRARRDARRRQDEQKKVAVPEEVSP